MSANEYVLPVRTDLHYWDISVSTSSFLPRSQKLLLIYFLESVKMAFNHLWNGFQSQPSPWTCRKTHQAKLLRPWSFFSWKCSVMVQHREKLTLSLVFSNISRTKKIIKYVSIMQKNPLELHSNCLSQTFPSLVALFFYSYCNVTNQGISTLGNMQTSLLSTSQPGSQSFKVPKNLQELQPCRSQNSSNWKWWFSWCFYFLN